jgi:hypothetical protein
VAKSLTLFVAGSMVRMTPLVVEPIVVPQKSMKKNLPWYAAPHDPLEG